ncbi:MAG: type II toxin-antitoxin system PemK/MazF family toxin [Velocimicrobium sp.]
MINQWDLWFADFPFEDSNQSKDRPVIVLNVDPLEVLSVKITTHNVRDMDTYDTPITKWREAGLKQESIARISKTTNLTQDKFRRKIGVLHNDDTMEIMKKYVEFINEIN